MADSNAPVQEKALDALLAFLKAADADAGRYLLHNLSPNASVVLFFFHWTFKFNYFCFI